MGANDEAIRRNILLTEVDVVAANRLWARRFALSPAAWICPVLTGAAVAAIWLARNQTTAGIIAALGAGLAAAFAVYILSWVVNFIWIPFGARRSFRETPGVRRPTDYVLGPDRVSYEQENSTGSMALGELVRWSANARYILLFTTRLTFYILPKAALSDEEVSRLSGWLDEAGVRRF
jgi:hypothetical protein